MAGDLLQQALGALARMRPRQQETTPLTPPEELQFRLWAATNGIRDVDHQESFYDYRGYWRDVVARGGNQTQSFADGVHFPDTYKQHGHPSFSVESRYSRGLQDGGRWLSDEHQIAPPMPSHKKGF